MTLRAAVFLDRDDTLIRCREVVSHGDLGNPAQVELLPGAREACESLKRAGFALVVVSNQGGVARGRFGIEDVERVHARVNELLGGTIDAFRYCPYHPKGVVPEYAREHPWRKPAPGMILDAAKVLGLDLARSWLIGDAERDIEAGRAAECRTVRIISTRDKTSTADYRETDIAGAAALVLRQGGSSSR